VNLKNITQNRADVLCRAITAAFYLDQDIRRDVTLILKTPEKAIQIDGGKVKGVRPDERSNAGILKKVLEGGRQPGVKLLDKYEITEDALWLDISGQNYRETSVPENPVFVIGGDTGMKAPDGARKISLGKKSYMGSHCITILNHWMDVQ